MNCLFFMFYLYVLIYVIYVCLLFVIVQRHPLATFSSSSRFLMAYDFYPSFFSQAMISSAKHSAMVLMVLKVFSLHPLAMWWMAYEDI